MMLEVRKAKLKDLEAIIKLNFQLFQKDFKYDKSLNMKWAYSESGGKYFKDRIIEANGCALVAESDKKILGYLVGAIQKGKDYRVKAKYAELENMLVLKDFRKKGVGGKLVRQFLKWCRKQGVDYVAVTASAGNELGIKFYEKQGFKEYDLTLEKKLG